MPNYDAESDEVKSDIRESAEQQVEAARKDAAVGFAVDEAFKPTDPYEDAVTGQLGDDVDTETLASWNLRRIRQVLGLSQQQVSDKLAEIPGGSRLSQSQLAKIERGERPWRVNEMFDLAEALGLDAFDFLSGQMGTDDGSLAVLAARLRYQRAAHAAYKAGETYRELLEVEHRAALKLLHTSTYQGIKDETALRWLEGQAAVAEDVGETLVQLGMTAAEVAAEPAAQPPVLSAADSVDARREALRAWAEREWERVAAEAKEAETVRAAARAAVNEQAE